MNRRTFLKTILTGVAAIIVDPAGLIESIEPTPYVTYEEIRRMMLEEYAKEIEYSFLYGTRVGKLQTLFGTLDFIHPLLYERR